EFIVRLPAIDTPAEIAAPEQSSRNSTRRRIAVMESDGGVRASLRVLLEMDGHDVVEARDGLQGVDTILRENADIALVDIGLSNLDCYGGARAGAPSAARA